MKIKIAVLMFLLLLGCGLAQAQQPVQITGPSFTDTYKASVFAPGELRVTQQPVSLFFEDFGSGSPNTTTKWKLASGTGGSSPTWSLDSASTSITPGTSANGYSLAQSLVFFSPQEPSYIGVEVRAAFENPLTSTAYRFWGLATTLATPTFANPVIDGCGFDLPASQTKMFAVCIQGTSGTSGSRVVIQDLSAATGNSKQPTDANAHKYFMWFQGSVMYWSIDTLDNIVATQTTGANAPHTNTLPLTIIAVQNGATQGTFTVSGASVADTGRNEQRVCDPTNGFTCAAVKAASTAAAATDQALVVSISPNSTPIVQSLTFGHLGAAMDSATGAAVPANAIQVGATDGTDTRVEYYDPCKFNAWTYFVVNLSSNTQIVAGSASKNVWICKMYIQPVAAAANVELVESATSGNACATTPTGMMGGNTAATGATLPINGGFVLPADGRAWAKTATAADAVCIFASAAVTGVIGYVQF